MGTVLRYLGRYTHRVAISNQRLLSFDGHSVSFRWKDIRSQRSYEHRMLPYGCIEMDNALDGMAWNIVHSVPQWNA